jgi:glutaredoxin
LTSAEQTGILIYTHPDCAYSAAAKMEYRRRRAEYVEVDVSKQPDRIPELLELTNGERVTPVIVENGQVSIGFKGGH